MNSIEKEHEWSSSQHIVFTRVLKDTFPKVDVDPINIETDLRSDAIPSLASQYDRLTNTDILLVYNVLNELPSNSASKVWRNIKFLIDIFQRPVLILLMEPSAPKAEPRIYEIKRQIAQQTDLIKESKEEVFHFTETPVCIQMNESTDCLNYRLFKPGADGARPEFSTSISRAHLSSLKIPDSPITIEQVSKQLSKLGVKRVRKGALKYKRGRVGPQYTFVSVSDEWKME